MITIKKISTGTFVKAVDINTPESNIGSIDLLSGAVIKKGFSPYIDTETGTWFQYDEEKKEFVDTGVYAGGTGSGAQTYIPGEGIKIEDNVISADEPYYKDIVEKYVDSNKLTQGDGIIIDENGVISLAIYETSNELGTTFVIGGM